MAEQEEATMEDLTDVLQSGMLGNPSDNALYTAAYIKENGPLTLTIEGFVKRRFTDKNGKTENAWVMKFSEGGPGCKLNLTRQDQLFSIMGTADISQIVSRQITLVHDPDVKFGKNKVGGIMLVRAEDLAGN
jgi:hypothetical protein